jgi:hypothetical protein
MGQRQEFWVVSEKNNPNAPSEANGLLRHKILGPFIHTPTDEFFLLGFYALARRTKVHMLKEL